MSTLREELAQRARGGDAAALELLLCAVPRELPAAVRRSVRDDRIIKLGLWIISETGFSRHRIAAMLATAGQRIECGRGLSDAPPFDVFTAGERAKLTAEIRAILRWATWPGYRQMLRVLTHDPIAASGRAGRKSAHDEHPAFDQTARRSQRPRGSAPGSRGTEIHKAS